MQVVLTKYSFNIWTTVLYAYLHTILICNNLYFNKIIVIIIIISDFTVKHKFSKWNGAA